MENEEIITALAYLGYKRLHDSKSKGLDIFQKEDRLNARIGNKQDISNLMNLASSDNEVKKRLLVEIKNTKSFIQKVRMLLIDKSLDDVDVPGYLTEKLDTIFNSLERNNFRRSFQDIYMLWFIVSPITLTMLKHNRDEIAQELKEIFAYSKSIPENHGNGYGLKKFISEVESLHKKYEIDSRKINLSENEIKALIAKQNFECPISKTPLRWGDLIEVDHIVPLGMGGKDEFSNLQVTHKDSNRSKGVKG
jgi:hypothetical protein